LSDLLMWRERGDGLDVGLGSCDVWSLSHWRLRLSVPAATEEVRGV
jgi:hypothetical protein